MVMSVNKALADSKARSKPFQAKHEVEYGIKVVSRHTNSVIDNVQCQFCRFHDWEQISSAKRKRAQSIKLFAPRYRTDNYQVHHKKTHVGKWNEYKAITFEDKKVLFNRRPEFKDTLFSFFDASSKLIFTISAS